MFRRTLLQGINVKFRNDSIAASKTCRSLVGSFIAGFVVFAYSEASANSDVGGLTEAEGQAIFAQYIDGRRLDRIAIQKFSVTDMRGVNGEAIASHIFQYFNASLRMNQDGGVATRKAGSDVEFPFGEIKVEALGNGATPSGLRRACAGQTLSIQGAVEWKLVDANWRAQGAKMKITYDPTMTVCGASSISAPNRGSNSISRAKQPPLPGEGRYMREYLQDAVKNSAKCSSVGEIFDLVKVGEGGYVANGRQYSTYEFSLQMSCLEGQPEHRYKGRVDYRGDVRFVVRIDPPL